MPKTERFLDIKYNVYIAMFNHSVRHYYANLAGDLWLANL
jgi:hypothetical protein